MRQIYVGCCKCRKAVSVLSAKRDIHRQVVELVVTCHGQMDRMVLADVDMQTCDNLLVFAERRRVTVKT